MTPKQIMDEVEGILERLFVKYFFGEWTIPWLQFLEFPGFRRSPE